MLDGGAATTSAHADVSRRAVGGTAYAVAAFRAIESRSSRPCGPLLQSLSDEALFSLLSGAAPLRWRLLVAASEWWLPWVQRIVHWVIPGRVRLISRLVALRSLVALRTAYIDREVNAAASEVSDPQLVVVGAGLDTRCVRLDALRAGIVFELDFAAMHDAKWSQLHASNWRTRADAGARAGRGPPSHVRSVGCDLSQGASTWRTGLLAAGFDESRPSIWLLEGLTSYLLPPELSALIESIAQLAAPGSHLVATFIAQSRPEGSVGDLCSMPMHRFWTDAPLSATAPFGPGRLITIGELAHRSAESAQTLQVQPDDESYMIVHCLRSSSVSPNASMPSTDAMHTDAVLPTRHAVETEARLRAEAAAWLAPANTFDLPWASAADVPSIDIGHYLTSGSRESLDSVAAQLRAAALSTGFMHLVGHGVAREVVARAFEAARSFHESLPADAKAALSMDGTPASPEEVRAGCGYLHDGNRKLPARPKPNMNAAFVVKRECGPRNVTLSRMPWPDELAFPQLSGFRGAVEAYCEAMERLALRMLPIFAVALGLPSDYFEPAFAAPLFRLRLSRYAPTPAGEYGINPHVDTSFFTILRPSASGLVVQKRASGEWLRVPFREDEDSFVVNFGELLSQATNDLWPATRHYAVNGEGSARYALPFFFNATPTYRMAVLPTCCSADNPPRYPPVSYLEGQGVQQGE